MSTPTGIPTFRQIAVATLLALALTSRLSEIFAQGQSEGITVQIQPDRIPALPGQTAMVTVDIDIPAARPPSEAPGGSPTETRQARFTVDVSSGTVNPGSWILNPEGDRVRGHQVLEYKTSSNPRPGEVRISIEGAQGLQIFGVLQAGSTLHRGLGRLFLVAGPDSGAPQLPSQTPPFTATPGAVDPTGTMVLRGAGIAALIGLVAGATWLKKRPGTKGPIERKAPPKPGGRPEPPKERSSRQRDPVLDVTLDADPTLVNGDATATATLRVIMEWGLNISGDIVGAKFTADRQGYSIEGSRLDQNEIVRTAKIPWEWGTANSDFVDVTFQVTVQAKPTSGAPGKPIARTATCVVRVAAANPALVLDDPSPAMIAATGCNDVTLKGTLWLFGAPTRGENIRLRNIRGSINERELKGKPGEPEKPGLPDTGAGVWTPPFLLQEAGYGEVVKLSVDADWTSGALHSVVPKPIPPLSTWCEVVVTGCQATFELDRESRQFVPIPDTVFRGLGTLMAAGDTSKGFDISQAKIHSVIRDLSQGTPGMLNGCKIPPRSPLDVEGSGKDSATLTPEGREKAKAVLDAVLKKHAAIATTDIKHVTKNAVLYTPGEEKEAEAKIRLWSYVVNSGQEPIHDGLVVASLILDDGFGGELEVRDQSAAQLGSVVLETGGPDFRIYESNLFCFELGHRIAEADPPRFSDSRSAPPPAGWLHDSNGNDVRDPQASFRLEFAVVDKDGKPLCAAGSLDVQLKAAAPRGDAVFFVGHTASDRDYYILSSDSARGIGESRETAARSFPQQTVSPAPGALVSKGWRKIDNDEINTSLFFRTAWRNAGHQKPEDALLFLDTRVGDKTQTSIEEWKDTTQALAVRVEMRDRNGNLIATSDRLAASGRGRTPPEFVWRDHRFRYVFATFRCRLYDSFAQPYTNCRYRLQFSDKVQQGEPGLLGDIELKGPLPADATGGTLEVLSPEGNAQDPLCSFSLKLGSLEPPDTLAGQQARLNNLGLFAATAVDGQQSEQLQRAWLRFLELTKLDLLIPAGWDPGKDQAAIEKLESLHDWYGLARLPRTDQPIAGQHRPDPAQGAPSAELHRGKLTAEQEEARLLAEAPQILAKRSAQVGLQIPNTLRTPNDPKVAAPGYWFSNNGANTGQPMRAITPGNEVLYLVDNQETFGAMADAFSKVSGPADFIYIIGWWLDQQFPLVPGAASTTMKNLLATASAKGAQVRAMLFSTLKPDFENPRIVELFAEIGSTFIQNLPQGFAKQFASLVGKIQMASVIATKLGGDAFIFPAPFMEWRFMNIINLLTVLQINELPSGAAVLDRRLLVSGAHHQKIVVVGAGGQITAFCGGLDLNADRAYARCEPGSHDAKDCPTKNPNHAGDTAGASFHDVHCRIRGPAAYDLLRSFINRWDDHPDAKVPPAATFGKDLKLIGAEIRKPLLGANLLGSPPRPARPDARHHVQIGRTFGNGRGMRGLYFNPMWPGAETAKLAGGPAAGAFFKPPAPPPEGYSFAPTGERTAREMIRNAIAQARRFIYVEDQYLVSPEARQWLLEALPRIHHLTCLIPDSSITSMGKHTSERRRMFIEPLIQAAPEKVRVFILRNPGDPHTYVHAKIWVVDDQFAIIGSANCNTRSYTHDSEAVAGIFDESSDLRCTYHLAHHMRVNLWAEHLNMDTDAGRAELADGVASAVHWLRPPSGARIASYDLNAPDVDEDEVNWDGLIDPNGE